MSRNDLRTMEIRRRVKTTSGSYGIHIRARLHIYVLLSTELLALIARLLAVNSKSGSFNGENLARENRSLSPSTPDPRSFQFRFCFFFLALVAISPSYHARSEAETLDRPDKREVPFLYSPSPSVL